MATHVRSEEAARLSLRGRLALRLVDKEGLGADLTVRLVEVAPEVDGGAPRPRHVHDGTGEFIWVLEGRGNVHATGAPFEVVAGEGVYVPPGELHKIQPLDGHPLKLLCFFATGDIASRTRE